MADKTPLHTIGDIRIDDDDNTGLYGKALADIKKGDNGPIEILDRNKSVKIGPMVAEENTHKGEFGWFTLIEDSFNDTSEDDGL